MRGLRQTLALSAFAAALLVPAFPLAAQEAVEPEIPNASPTAAVVATVDGRTVTLDASGSADPDGTVVAYTWDLDGDGVHETETGAEPVVERSFPTGTALVASVRVVDGAGAADEATATVEVLAQPEPEPEPAVRRSRAPEEEGSRTEAGPGTEARVTAAASRSVTISDFEFSPATVNIGTGDSVTWTNRGPSIHTATANDGSFDSGNLSRGGTYSKTFTEAGTYAYICTPHPFMTGRVVVAGAGGSGGGSGSGDDDGSGGGDAGTGASGSGTGTAPGSGSGGDLARTGVDLLPWSLFGLGLFAFGATLRWRLAAN